MDALTTTNVAGQKRLSRIMNSVTPAALKRLADLWSFLDEGTRSDPTAADTSARLIIVETSAWFSEICWNFLLRFRWQDRSTDFGER